MRRGKQSAQEHGLDLDIKTPGECVQIEPALEHSKVRFIGRRLCSLRRKRRLRSFFAKNLSAYAGPRVWASAST